MQAKLNKLLENSYSPYSQVKVSAIVIDSEGNEFKGVNVENASYGATICAERAAILSALSNGCKNIKELHLTSSLDKPLYPCGICRQVMCETMDAKSKVSIWNEDEVIETTVKELLPNGVKKRQILWK